MCCLKFIIWFIFSDTHFNHHGLVSAGHEDVGANDDDADIRNHGLGAGYLYSPVGAAENPAGMVQGEADRNHDFVGLQEVHQLEQIIAHHNFGRYIDNDNSSNNEQETSYEVINVEADQPETTRVANLRLPMVHVMPSRRLEHINYMCEVTILDGNGSKHLVTMCHAHFHKTNFVSYSFASKMGFPHVNVKVGNKIETRCQIDTLSSNGKLFRGSFLPVAAIEHLVNMADCIALHNVLTSKKNYLIIGTKMFESMMKQNESIHVENDLVCVVEKKNEFIWHGS